MSEEYEREWEDYQKQREKKWHERWEEYEREWEEHQRELEKEWEEYERLWNRVIELTKKFYESAAEDKDPQNLDNFLDDMLQRLREAGYAPLKDD